MPDDGRARFPTRITLTQRTCGEHSRYAKSRFEEIAITDDARTLVKTTSWRRRHDVLKFIAESGLKKIAFALFSRNYAPASFSRLVRRPYLLVPRVMPVYLP